MLSLCVCVVNNIIIVFGQVGLCVVHSARYMLSNTRSRSQSWDYIIKPYFQSHQILPGVNENVLAAF